MSRYIWEAQTEKAITATPCPTWSLVFHEIKILPRWLLKARGHLWNKTRIKWKKEVFLSKTASISDTCIKRRGMEKQAWKRVQKGRNRVRTWVLAPTSSANSWEHKQCEMMGKNVEAPQKISGHLCCYFHHKFLLILIIKIMIISLP